MCATLHTPPLQKNLANTNYNNYHYLTISMVTQANLLVTPNTFLPPQKMWMATCLRLWAELTCDVADDVDGFCGPERMTVIWQVS